MYVCMYVAVGGGKGEIIYVFCAELLMPSRCPTKEWVRIVLPIHIQYIFLTSWNVLPFHFPNLFPPLY